MVLTILTFAVLAAGGGAPFPDTRTIFAQWETYCSSFKDVTFLYEGTLEDLESKDGKRDPARTFQGLYAFRNDGATLIDVYGLGDQGRPGSRILCSLLGSRMEKLDASPDFLPKVQDRVPITAVGGAGSLDRPDAPERIFLAWFFRGRGDPAEYEIQPQGWEEVEGRRCLKLQMPDLPRSQAHRWHGEPNFFRLWLDPDRGSYPLRWEDYSGRDVLDMRVEIQHLERVALPDGRSIWFPREGRIWSYGGSDAKGRPVVKKEPTFLETRTILINTVKFDQGLKDSYFSVKPHVSVASHEDLRKIQQELDRIQPAKPKFVRTDPASVKQHLDKALAEADRQAQRLEASSAARAGAGWSEILPWGLGASGVLLFAVVAFRRWGGR
ncbi:MAG: hypothetical protein ACP5XB_01385 [Isosphaeraceae bacterium]